MDVSKVPLGRHQVEKTSIRSVGRCQIVVQHRKSSALAARSAGLLGRVEQSSPNAAWRRAEGAGLDGEGADRAIICVATMRVVFGHCPRDQGAIIPNLGWLHQTIAIGALIGWSCTILRSPASSPIPLTRARRTAGLTVNHTAAGRLGHDSPTACACVMANRGPSVGGGRVGALGWLRHMVTSAGLPVAACAPASAIRFRPPRVSRRR